MTRASRRELIREIQTHRDSLVVTYITGDRQPIVTQIAEDVIRLLYDHLLAMPAGNPKLKRIDLFLYSRGGDVSVPWRIVSMMREFADEFCILIPYKAQSAATMIALGSDEILMGRKAELGPIDPSLMKASGSETTAPLQISVEDVSSYLAFLQDRAKVTDQAALAQLIAQLTSQVTPVTLGSIQRQYSHIRLVARKLLASRNDRTDEDKAGGVIDALTEKLYSHGHAIGRKEADELGLWVKEPEPELEALMWRLFVEYEQYLELADPLDPEGILDTNKVERYTLDKIPIAVIESVAKLHVCEANIEIQRTRNVPPNPQINVNIQLQLPAGFDANKLPAQMQQILQQMVAQVSQVAGQQVRQEIERQSPVVGTNVRIKSGKWADRTSDKS